MTIILDGTKGITVPDGSVSEPSLRGTSSNSGIVYTNNDITLAAGGVETLKASANVVTITTSGAERLRIGPLGQIGVGGATYGSNGQVLTSQGSSLAPIWTNLPASFEIVLDARTSNVILGVADRGNLIDITSGTFTQTFDACATLGSGWFCYIRNSGSGDITLDPNGSETIDGRDSFIMYPNETRLVYSTGTDLRSIVMNSFYRVFTTSGTFVKPPGYSMFSVDAIGGGGGGAAGRSWIGPLEAERTTGGAGGGGGGRFITKIEASLLAISENVTIGSGGLGATANSTVNAIAYGANGGSTGIGSFVFATGGGGGYQAQGSFNSAMYSTGGAALVSHVSVVANNTTGFAGAPTGANTSYSAEFGGGSGALFGTSNISVGGDGGGSLFGGGGGGCGASGNTTISVAGGVGGAGGSYSTGGGGAAGASGGGAGGNGADGNIFISGSGGGGGGAGTTVGTGAGNGGNGGIPGGGGGGGGARHTSVSLGNGGDGGRGELRIWGIV